MLNSDNEHNFRKRPADTFQNTDLSLLKHKVHMLKWGIQATVSELHCTCS